MHRSDRFCFHLEIKGNWSRVHLRNAKEKERNWRRIHFVKRQAPSKKLTRDQFPFIPK